MKIKNTSIDVICADITGCTAEAFVNAAYDTRPVRLSGRVEGYTRVNMPAVAGSTVWVSNKRSAVRYRINVIAATRAGTIDEHTIRRACANAFDCAHRLQVRSLAFPALGCGVGEFPPVGAAKILAQEILRYVREHGRAPIKKITVCTPDKKIYPLFKKTIIGYLTHVMNDLSWGPYVTTDAIIEYNGGVVLIERSNPPYGWALPGGFVDYGESLEDAVAREAREETNLTLTHLRQLHTYSRYGRDPRFHTVTAVFTARGRGRLRSGDDAKGARVVITKDLLKLQYAFDHKQVIRDYLAAKNRKPSAGGICAR